jgi:hypothetical protein
VLRQHKPVQWLGSLKSPGRGGWGTWQQQQQHVGQQ